MRTIDEAIKHCEEAAEKLDKLAVEFKEQQDNYVRILGTTYKPDYGQSEECVKQATENRQLAEWLKTLKVIWDSGDCNDCKNRECLYKPKLGHLVRYNCPFYRKEEVNTDERDSN